MTPAVQNLFDLSGRVALVTGGAQGLGRAICVGLANHGAAVGGAGRHPAGADETVRLLRAASQRAAAFRCDVALEADVNALVAAVLAEFGQIDILVNNAGITKRIALFDWKQSDWEEVIRINQVGTFVVARAVGKHMTLRRRGSIVNMSALGGGVLGLGRGYANECSTQGADDTMMREVGAE